MRKDYAESYDYQFPEEELARAAEANRVEGYIVKPLNKSDYNHGKALLSHHTGKVRLTRNGT